MRKYNSILPLCIAGLLFLSVACAKQAQVSGQEQSSNTNAAFTMMAEQNLVEGMKFFILDKYEPARQQFEKAYAKDPESGGINYMLAKVYYLEGNANQALFHIQKALKAESLNVYYLSLLAQIYEDQQKYTEAIKVYKKMIAEIPGTTDRYFDLASLYLYTKKYQDALATYGKIEEYYGKSPELTKVKQKIWMQLDKPDMAVQEGQSLINAYPGETEYTVMQAEFLFSLGRNAEAQKILEDILKENPEDPYAHLALSEVYRSNGNADQAMAELEYVFRSDEMSLDTKLELLEGMLHYAKSDAQTAQAVKLCTILSEKYPQESRAWAALGEAQLLRNEHAQAWNSFLKAKQFDISNYGLWRRIILLDSELGKQDSVLVHTEQALEVFPNNAELWFYKGVANYQKKNYKQSAEDLESCIMLGASNKELKLSAYGLLGDAYNGMKDYPSSDQAYEKALALDPEDAHVLNNYAYFLSVRNEKMDKAEAMSATLVKKYPTNPTYLDTYGWVLYKQAKYEEAEKYLSKAAGYAPSNGTIVEHYGDALFRLGKKEEAVAQWKQAQKTGKASDKIEKKIQDKTLYE